MVGFGSTGKTGLTQSLIALRSCSNRQLVLLAFCMGNIGVLQGHEVGTITPCSKKDSITGAIPASASGLSGY